MHPTTSTAEEYLGCQRDQDSAPSLVDIYPNEVKRWVVLGSPCDQISCEQSPRENDKLDKRAHGENEHAWICGPEGLARTAAGNVRFPTLV
jgi:hypothetical protein